MRFAGGWVIAAVLAAAPLQAQQGLRDVSGTVTDEHHEPLRGAVVYCENDATQEVVTYLTDRGGNFRLRRLSGDLDYHVWAMYRGVVTKKRFLSKFDAKSQREMDFVVRLR